MKKLILIAYLMPSLALGCTKHDSYDTWYKKGLIKIQKDGSLTCEAKVLGIKNCAEAMPYIYKKHKKRG